MAGLCLCSVIVAGNFLLLKQSSIRISPNILWIWLATGLLVVALAVMLRVFRVETPRPWARASATVVLCVSGLLQAAGVWLGRPELSDDGIRYATDGRMWLAGVSPYAHSPQEVARWLTTRSTGTPQVPPFQPHGELKTIYPPTAQGVFVAAALGERLIARLQDQGISENPSRPPAAGSQVRHGHGRNLLFHRCTAALCAMAITLLLLGILRKLNRSPWYATLFAWNPLAVTEMSVQGHIDAFGVLLLVAAVAVALRQRHHLGAALLALAAGVKPHVAALGPVLVAIVGREAPTDPV
ncbi:MAG: hypothetical protein NZ561_13425, partial [Phycisphaerae bacterium]|nr:hypothetical protein [Phycisphaerae bacterium]